VFPREGVANINDGTIIKSIVVSSNWNGDINNNVRITFNEGLNIIGWTITTSNDIPYYFEEVQNDFIEEKKTIEEEVYNDENSIYDDNFYTEYEEQQPQGYNSSFTVSKELMENTIYYAWIKDAYNNTNYQTFTISKVEI